MFSVQEMHSEKDGYQAGSSIVPNSQESVQQIYPAALFGATAGRRFGLSHRYPSKYPYMMWAPRMTMDMFMFMGMYSVTDRLTVMGMVNYQSMNMTMNMDMGNQPPPYFTGYRNIDAQAPMVTAGLGNSEFYAIYKIYGDRTNGNVNATLGLNVPTGSTTQQTAMMGYTYRAPYDMQLGGGTFNVLPALTYTWLTPDSCGTWERKCRPTFLWEPITAGLTATAIRSWDGRSAPFGENLSACAGLTPIPRRSAARTRTSAVLNFPCNPFYAWEWAPHA